MENRYLFKGKRLDNGEWVTGNLIQNPFFKGVRSWISSEQEDKTRLRSISRTQALWNSIEVDSSTICQCTGLKDKNGKLIWENDIMVAHLDKDNPEDITYVIVAWRENGWVTIENGSDDLNPIDDFTTENFEVVSTRFDNPELLESED